MSWIRIVKSIKLISEDDDEWDKISKVNALMRETDE